MRTAYLVLYGFGIVMALLSVATMAHGLRCGDHLVVFSGVANGLLSYLFCVVNVDEVPEDPDQEGRCEG